MSIAASEPAPPALEVRDVVKSYGATKALNGISLSVRAGEFVALLGPNGAGKSTLFQLLSGLFIADRGDISVLGHDIGRTATQALAGIGIVFQQPTLDLDLSVRANLRFNARLHGLRGVHANTRIDEEMRRLELTEHANDLARTLSGGNRRRVELARALVHEPAVLLMDEATVGLDPGSRRHLLQYVLSLCNNRGVGVLWATHLVDEAEVADRVVVLHDGNVLKDESPQALVASCGESTLGQAFLGLTAPKASRLPRAETHN